MNAPGTDAGEDAHPVVRFNLRVRERTIDATARLPVGRVRLLDLLPILRKFNDAIIGASVADAQDAGHSVSCRAGCGACCRQVVPISETEALALLEWIDLLPAGQQEMLRERFRAATEAFAVAGMLERTREAHTLRDGPDSLRFALDYFAAGVPCPFLVDESCGIYAVRPMKCREYLVTSPAANCTQPTAETVAMVELPATFSRVLFHFGGAAHGGPSKWLPLVQLFEWGEQHRAIPQRTDESIALFREFLAAFVEATPDELEKLLPDGVGSGAGEGASAQ